jgi:hypothetical protein
MSAAGEINKELHEKITAFTKEYRLVDTLMFADKAVNDTTDFLNSLEASHTHIKT